MASGSDHGPIRVLVSDSRRMWSELLAATLRQDPRFTASVALASPTELAEQAVVQRADIMLVGVESDDSNGSAFEMLRVAHQAVRDLKSVVLLEFADGELMREAFRAGARGVINRGDSADILMECLCCVVQGRIWARTDHFSSFLDLLGQSTVARPSNAEATHEALTRREVELVECVSQGLTNREIALQLNLSEHTVRNYLFRIFRKFGVSNRAELVGSALHAQRKSEGVATVES